MRLTLKPLGKGKSRGGRRKRTPLLRQRPVIIGLCAATAVILFAAGWHLVAIDWPARAWQAANAYALRTSVAAGLAVSEVVVEGRSHARRKDLLAALDVSRGAPILAFDPEAARSRVEALGWVRQAIVARRLPDVVYLRIEERVPLALWQRNGKLALIDREGTVIRGQDVAAFGNLPLVVGENAPKHAAALLDLLPAFPTIAAQTDAAIRVSDRRWNLRLASGIDIRLPEKDVAAALGRLAELHTRQNVLDRDVIAVDLRKPDRLIVRVNPAARDRIGLDGKNT